MAAALRMTDNEPVFSALTSASAGTGSQGSSSELQHANSSQSTSSEETPLPSKLEAEETKGHTADDEGKSVFLRAIVPSRSLIFSVLFNLESFLGP